MARHSENIRKRKDGRWEARVICGHQANGRTKYKYLYGQTYDEVRRRKYEMTARNLLSQTTIDNKKRTMAELLEEWLNTIQNHVKESTMAKYQYYVRKHIIPEMGHILLSDLSSDDIEQFKNQKLTAERRDKKGGLSPKTVTDMLSVLKLALAYGEEKKYLFAGQIKIRNPRQNKPHINILTVEEQRILLEHVLNQEDTAYLGIVIALYTSLRIGEICALRWEDIDLVHDTLHVCRTIMRITNYDSARTEKTKIIIETPKTECSNRLIPIPEFLKKYLSHFQKDDSHYVITGKQSFMEPRNYYRKYKRIMKECNLVQFNFHALRHTFATRCIEKEFDVKSLSEILGHADVSITMQRYAHPSMNLKRYYMEKLEVVTFRGIKEGHDNEKILN